MISGSNGQWPLDRAFDIFSNWQWIRPRERIVEGIVIYEAKRRRRLVCSCLEERRRNTRI